MKINKLNEEVIDSIEKAKADAQEFLDVIRDVTVRGDTIEVRGLSVRYARDFVLLYDKNGDPLNSANK